MESSALNTDPIPPAPIEIMGDRVLIWPDKDPTVTYGGIIIPDGVVLKGERELLFGRFVKQGPGMLCADGSRYPMKTEGLKHGDRLVYNRHGSTTVTIGDHKFVVVHDDVVEAAIEPE
jgi:co-chaperonin GroES (HSP10)